MTWAYAQDIQPSSAKFVLVTLANYASPDGYCYPSQETLARDTGQSPRSVWSHLADMESRGILVRERRNDKHGHRKSDGFWLVGFKPLPEESASSLPEESASRNESLLATSAIPTRNERQSLLATAAEPYIEGTVSIEPSVEPSVTARTRARDEHWDVLVDIFGFSPTPKTDEHGAWNRALKTWRAIGATADDVRYVADRYREEYPRMAFTVSAITRHAEQLLHGTRPPPSITELHPAHQAIAAYRREDNVDYQRIVSQQTARPESLPTGARGNRSGVVSTRADVRRGSGEGEG